MLIFDIETDGLLNTLTKVHCLCIIDTNQGDKEMRFSQGEVAKGVKLLQNAISSGGSICGHNIINFDVPALQKLYGLEVTREQRVCIKDTLVLAYLKNSSIKDTDYNLARQGILPKSL